VGRTGHGAAGEDAPASLPVRDLRVEQGRHHNGAPIDDTSDPKYHLTAKVEDLFDSAPSVATMAGRAADRAPSHPVVNLDDYDSVAAFARHIVWALGLPIEHPSHMPVTRDLSGAKRALLLRWLREVGADGKPKRVVVSTAAANPAAGRALNQPAPRFSAQAFNAKRKLTRHRPADAL
jgi:hypothetical protein